MDLSQIIITPIVTEKAYTLQAAGKYVFKVNKNANKISIKQAFEKFYGIKPTSVTITMMKLKTRAVQKGSITKRDAFKKAVITLPKGKSIDITKLSKDKKK
jgi:large subunit ribosomal protein L23